MKQLIIILLTIITTAMTIATICFRACKKRIDITSGFWNFKSWKVVDSEWEKLIDL